MNWDDVREKLQGIPYLMSVGQAQVLFEEAQKLFGGADLLEIGAWKGYSTCALAYGCLNSDDKHVWTIDTFRGNPNYTDRQDGEFTFSEFWANVVARDLDSYITPLVGRSEEFYRTWIRPLDLLFIDGGHTPDVVQGDINAFLPHLKRGGVLLLHDVYATEKVIENPNWMGLDLPLARCQYNDNLAWGYKR